MKLLIKIAWRNIWRNKVRSFVVITAIGLGLWAGVFVTAFVQGMMVAKIQSIIEVEVSHMQFHAQGFRDDLKTSAIIPNSKEKLEALKNDPKVEAASGRLISMAMIGSANKNGSVRVVGVDPEKETETSVLHERLTEGAYFEGIKRNPVLISERLAEKYKLKLRSKLVLTLQDKDGEITAGAFRVVGLYKTDNNMYDNLNVFVRNKDLRKLTKIDNDYHEIAAILTHQDLAEEVAGNFQSKYPNLEILPWLDLAPGMRLMSEIIGLYLYIIVGIVLLALLFSIVNTMLMAVLERIKELGMLMAVGMNKTKVFSMIMIETVFMCMLGAPIGFIISYGMIEYFGKHGIDLSGAAYEDAGFSSIIYPYLENQSYLEVTGMVLVMAILAAIYPALKALRLNPATAIRKI